mgnify:FL=1
MFLKNERPLVALHEGEGVRRRVNLYLPQFNALRDYSSNTHVRKFRIIRVSHAISRQVV